MIKDLEEDIIDKVAEAKRQGHRFIKLFLNRNMVQRNKGEILISGAVALIGTKKGSGFGGLPDFDFKPKQGESLHFSFSREEMEYMCWMFDDQGPGYFSSVGYNRDLLASHLEEDFFVIPDPAVLEDVKKRHSYMKANPGKKNHMREPAMMSTTAESVEDIDAQIEYLKSRKENIKPQTVPTESSKDEHVIPEGVPTDNVPEEKAPNPRDQKDERNRKQREYRARKKKEKEMATA
jgi:hypothetical protein